VAVVSWELGAGSWELGLTEVTLSFRPRRVFPMVDSAGNPVD
jgi:hypothetical protein